VFSNGNWNGLKVRTPSGGHTRADAPLTCAGYRAKWKYAQKKPTKNMTSLAMNSVMP